jgi:hypothetical protein
MPWGALTEQWVPHDTRDTVIDIINKWSEKAEIGKLQLVD